MKNALIFSILLCCKLVQAQGPQQLVNVPYIGWGGTVKGWLYLPADYDTSSKRYPVVFFYHGVGEAGSDPYVLLWQGLPKLIADGMRPDNIINPSDGQAYSFIVLSVQSWWWSPGSDWLPYELEWLKNNYRIDTNRVYVTGLSAGGQSSFNATVNNPDVSRLIAAAVPMSPAALGSYDPTLINQNKIETWFFSGNVDGNYTANATLYSEECNTQYPGSSKLNIYSGGHCCWNTYYDINWHDPATGMSIWEWMLTNQRDPVQSEPLPVRSISLEARKDDHSVEVSWKVEEEVNVLRYEVEKSSNGASFTKLGDVTATGNSRYEYTDWQLQSKCYYRIRVVDIDGRSKYSSILSFISGKASVVLKAYPNPVQKETIIQHPSATSRSRITIHAADGRMIRSIALKQGMQQTTLDLSSLQSGLYILKYADDRGEQQILKLNRGF